MTISAEQIAEWLRLADAATEGPWLYRPKEFDDWGFVRSETGALVSLGRAGQYVGEDGYAEHRAAGTDPFGSNAKFTAASRTAVPALIREIKRLRAQIENLKS